MKDDKKDLEVIGVVLIVSGSQEERSCEEEASSGPRSRVATNAYRNGWERLFGKKESSELN